MDDTGKTSRKITKSITTTTSAIKKKILIFLNDECKPYNSVTIAENIKENPETVRRYLYELAKTHQIIAKKYGRTTHWVINKPAETLDYELKYRIQQDSNIMLPETHYLMLYVDKILSQNKRVGLYCVKCGKPIFSIPNFCKTKMLQNRSRPSTEAVICGTKLLNDIDYNFKWQNRTIKIRFGKTFESCSIWVKASKNTMDFTTLKRFFDKLEEKVGMKFWDAIDLWRVKQYGINNDIVVNCEDNKTGWRLIDFCGAMAQIYEKDLFDDTHVKRLDFHEKDIDYLMNQWMAMMQGSMGLKDVVNQNFMIMKRIDNMVDAFESISGIDRKTTKRMDYLLEKIDSLEREIKELKKKDKKNRLI